MNNMDLRTFVMRLGLALILGTVVGIERQWHHRMAGTRTNALVATAASVFAMIGISLGGGGEAARVIGQIVSGVGFLGAGVIFKEGGTVHGLNTAATVWCSAAIGALAGIGYPQYAGAVAVAVILTNVALRPLAFKWGPKSQETSYQLDLTCGSKDDARLRALLLAGAESNHLAIASLTSALLEPEDRMRITAGMKAPARNDKSVEQLVAILSLEAGVDSISWRVEMPPAIE